MRDLDDRPIAIEPVNRFAGDLARLGSAIAGIGEIDPPLAIDAQVVRRVESLALIAIGDHFAEAGLEIPAANATASAVGTVA